MGGYQNYGPFLGPLNTKCRIILRTQKGTIILTTTHIEDSSLIRGLLYFHVNLEECNNSGASSK